MAELDEILTEVRAINTRIDTVVLAELRAVNQRIDSLGGRIDGRLDSMNSRIDTLIDAISDLRRDLDTHSHDD